MNLVRFRFLITLMMFCCAVILLASPALSQIQKTICPGEDIDDGYVVVSDMVEKPDRCYKNTQLGSYYGVVVRKPGDIELVCSWSPRPPNYMITENRQTRACSSGWGVIIVRKESPTGTESTTNTTASPRTTTSATTKSQNQSEDEGIQLKNVCIKNATLDKGFVIVGTKNDSTCSGSASDRFFAKNAYIVRRPNAQDVVCAIGGFPSNYEVDKSKGNKGYGQSPGCAENREETGETVYIKRKQSSTSSTQSQGGSGSTVAGYTQWMNSVAFKKMCNTMIGKQYYPARIEGYKETQNDESLYRAFFIPIPTDKFQVQYDLGVDLKTNNVRDDTLTKLGFTLISYQYFTDSTGEKRYQAVWVKR